METYREKACGFLSENEKRNTSSLSSGQKDAVEEILSLYLRGEPIDVSMAFSYMQSYTVGFMTIFQEIKDILCKNKEWKRTYHFCIAEIIKTFSNKLFVCDSCRLALRLHPFINRGDSKYESRYDAKLFPIHPNFATSNAKYRVYLENYFLYSAGLGVKCPKCHNQMTYPFYNFQLQLLSPKQYKHRNDSLFWKIVNNIHDDRFLDGLMRNYSDDRVVRESIRGLTPPLPPEMQSRRPDVVHPRQDIPPFHPQYDEIPPQESESEPEPIRPRVVARDDQLGHAWIEVEEPESTEPEEEPIAEGETRAYTTSGLDSYVYHAQMPHSRPFRPLLSTGSEGRLRELQRERIETERMELERGREERLRQSLARLIESEQNEGDDND